MLSKLFSLISPCKLSFKSSIYCHFSWVIFLLTCFYKTSWWVNSKEEALWEFPTLWQIDWERSAWDIRAFGELVQLHHQDIFSGICNKIHSVSRAICVTKELLASLFLWVISFMLSLGQVVAWGMVLREKSGDEVTSERNDRLFS